MNQCEAAESGSQLNPQVFAGKERSPRLRQRLTMGCGSREASLTMVFMLARPPERHWRRLNSSEVIVHVLDGKQFKDGLMVQENAA